MLKETRAVVARNIVIWLKASGLSPSRIARDVGISPSSVRLYVNGTAAPNAATLQKLLTLARDRFYHLTRLTSEMANPAGRIDAEHESAKVMHGLFYASSRQLFADMAAAASAIVSEEVEAIDGQQVGFEVMPDTFGFGVGKPD